MKEINVTRMFLRIKDMWRGCVSENFPKENTDGARRICKLRGIGLKEFKRASKAMGLECSEELGQVKIRNY